MIAIMIMPIFPKNKHPTFGISYLQNQIQHKRKLEKESENCFSVQCQVVRKAQKVSHFGILYILGERRGVFPL